VKVSQRTQLLIHNQPNAASTPAIAPVRATFGDIFLPAKAHTAVPAIASLNPYHDPIDHRFPLHRIITSSTVPATAISTSTFRMTGQQ
jgi:hypothetical protein